MEYLNNEKKIDGGYFKKISKAEYQERKFRADPFDGLRPPNPLDIDCKMVKNKKFLLLVERDL